jgi:hypothetical protein
VEVRSSYFAELRVAVEAEIRSSNQHTKVDNRAIQKWTSSEFDLLGEELADPNIPLHQIKGRFVISSLRMWEYINSTFGFREALSHGLDPWNSKIAARAAAENPLKHGTSSPHFDRQYSGLPDLIVEINAIALPQDVRVDTDRLVARFARA